MPQIVLRDAITKAFGLASNTVKENKLRKQINKQRVSKQQINKAPLRIKAKQLTVTKLTDKPKVDRHKINRSADNQDSVSQSHLGKPSHSSNHSSNLSPNLSSNLSQSNSKQLNFSQSDLSGGFFCQAKSPLQMTVCGLNHFNITASKALIEEVKQFYTEVVGLKLGPRAHLDHDGYWLYAGAMPIVHLSIASNMLPISEGAKGYFNHISLSCVGLKRAIAKMEDTHTPYRLIQLPDIHQTQLFITDPASTGVELTFFDESL